MKRKSRKYGTYRVLRLTEDTYMIQDYGFTDSGAVCMYLLIGKKKALLIDSGYGGRNLAGVVKRLTEKEVVCVSTHGHVDHALGAYQFSEAYIHSGDQKLYKAQISGETLTACAYQGIIGGSVNKIKGEPHYRENAEKIIHTERRILDDIDNIPYFELGRRRVSWRALPGHTKGSIVFLDERDKTVYEGDAAPAIPWLFLDESSSVDEYRKQLDEYEAWLAANGIRRRFTGHMTNARALSIRPVKRLQKLCTKIVQGKKRGFPVEMPAGGKKYNVAVCIQIGFGGLSGIIYRQGKIK